MFRIVLKHSSHFEIYVESFFYQDVLTDLFNVHTMKGGINPVYRRDPHPETITLSRVYTGPASQGLRREDNQYQRVLRVVDECKWIREL